MKSIMKTFQTENGIQTIIKQKGEYTLLAKHYKDGSFHEYVVCLDYHENGSWWHGNYFGDDLLMAIDCFETRTNPNHISRRRLEEIATITLDGLVDNDIYEDYEGDLDLNSNEIVFFGVEKEEIVDDDWLIEDEIYADEMEYERGGEAPWWL